MSLALLNAQNAINTLFILCLSGIGWWLRNEFARIELAEDGTLPEGVELTPEEEAAAFAAQADAVTLILAAETIAELEAIENDL